MRRFWPRSSCAPTPRDGSRGRRRPRRRREAARAAGATLMAVGLHPMRPSATSGSSTRTATAASSSRCAGSSRVHPSAPCTCTSGCLTRAAVAGAPRCVRRCRSSRGWVRTRRSGSAATRASRAPARPWFAATRTRRASAVAGLGGVLSSLDAIQRGGGPQDHTMVWWDVRLQPRLGTVELRELDVQAGLEEAAGLVALVHALVRRGSSSRRTSPHRSRRSRGRGSARCVRGSTRRCPRGTADVVARGGLDAPGVARKGRSALEGIERILSDGGGADRQRAVRAQGACPPCCAIWWRPQGGGREA